MMGMGLATKAAVLSGGRMDFNSSLFFTGIYLRAKPVHQG
jgi:hypothetical protein